MLKYYYDLMSQPSRACYIFLKRNKIPFTPCPLRISRGEHRSEEYTKINPFQLVPAIEHNGFNLTESVAILRYLCREFPDVGKEWYPSDSKTQARIDEYLEWQHLNTRMQLAMYFQTKFAIPLSTKTEPNLERIEGFRKGMEVVLNRFETRWLKDHPYVGGEKMSIADLLAICELEQPSLGGYDVTADRPILSEYFFRMRENLQPDYDEANLTVYKFQKKYGVVPQKPDHPCGIMSSIEFNVLSLERDEEEVLELFRDFFITGEPTGLGLGATTADLFEFFKPVVKQCLESGMSYGAKDTTTGKVIGIILNKTLTPAVKTTFDGHVSVSVNKKIASFHSIFAEVENAVDIFEKYNVQKVLELGLVTIDKKYNGNGITKILIEKSEELGRNNGCELSQAQCTNLITQHVMSRMGYQTYYTYDFAKNKDIDLNKTLGSKGWVMLAKKL